MSYQGEIAYESPREVRELLDYVRGPTTVATGTLWCWYYRRGVLAIDFTNEMITDFGYTDYSTTTTRNIRGWMQALRDRGIRLDDLCVWSHFTRNRDSGRRGQKFIVLPYFEEFRDRVPWRVIRDGNAWFHWPSFNHALCQQYWDSFYFLRREQNWRYWEFAWIDGRWDKRFLSDDAKRRWEQREKRRCRATKPPTKTP